MRKPDTASTLTKERLRRLKEHGYLYILIKSYTPDRKTDFIELDHFNLVPVKELPEAQGEKGIFAPIDSEILEAWAEQSEGGIKAYIEGYSSYVKD
jgi:hypothetical protein